MNLDELALKYGTDKGPQSHHYTEQYEELFSEMRDRHLKILEIGVLAGASVKMWRDYFPNAQVVGIDINLQLEGSERLKILQCDAASAGALVSMAEREGLFDIVIDDGSHAHVHHMTAFYSLFPFYMKRRGMYFIEDLHGDHPTKHYLKKLELEGADTRLIGVQSIEFMHVDNLVLMRKVP